MEIIKVYKCLCDVQRIRILNLLREGPLCVCHLVDILESDQVKVSKQLRYMKQLGVLQGRREAQWMVYRLVDNAQQLLLENLDFLYAHHGQEMTLSEDLKNREKAISQIRDMGIACPEVVISEKSVADHKKVCC